MRDLKTDAAIKKTEFTKKLTEAKALIDKYKSVAQTAVDRYIKSQAILVGTTAQEIRNRLPENYSFNDIDKVCESLKGYKLNINSLPFDASQRQVKMKVSESIEPIIKHTGKALVDDEPDEQLMRLAGN